MGSQRVRNDWRDLACIHRGNDSFLTWMHVSCLPGSLPDPSLSIFITKTSTVYNENSMSCLFSVFSEILILSLIIYKLLPQDKDTKLGRGQQIFAYMIQMSPIFQRTDRRIDIKKTREAHWRINYLGAEVWNCFILLNLNIKWIFLSPVPGFILSGFSDIFSLVIYTWKRVFSICFWWCISSGQIINMFPEFHTYLSIKWSSYLNHL